MQEKTYYEERKKELQADFQKAVFEAYDDIERAVIKKLNKQKELQGKLQELEVQQKEKDKEKNEKKTPK